MPSRSTPPHRLHPIPSGSPAVCCTWRLRRIARMNPVLAAVFSGTALFLFVDEGLTPTLGLSAPNNQYPLTTHLRGFLGHLAYGAGVAVTAETLLANRDKSPRSSSKT